MGACTFITSSKGRTAAEAFHRAVKEATDSYGRSYTGTIAEKSGFTIITLPRGEDPVEYARNLLDSDDPRVSDKWGPAGCISTGIEDYVFFGWASE